MRVFIAYCVFFNPGRGMATGFTNVTGITSRTSKLINHHGLQDKWPRTLMGSLVVLKSSTFKLLSLIELIHI